MQSSDKNIFENTLKDIFADASTQPPTRVWERIEAGMEQERIFKDEWRERLENVSTPPPARVWEAIENELDKDNRRPLAWWQTNRRWLAAASVLLLLWAGNYFVKPNESTPSDIASMPQPKQVAKKTIPPVALQTPDATNIKSAVETSNQTQIRGSKLAKASTKALPTEKLVEKEVEAMVAQKSVGNKEVLTSQIPKTSHPFKSEAIEQKTQMTANDIVPQNTIPTEDVPTILPTEISAETPKTNLNFEAKSLLINDLTALSVIHKEPIITEKIITPTRPQAIPQPKPFYIEAGGMVAGYNANINIYSLGNVATNSTQSFFSFGTSLRAGVNLSKRLSLETGVGHFTGNSLYNDRNSYISAVQKSMNDIYVSSRVAASATPANLFSAATMLSWAIKPTTAITPIANQVQITQIPLQLNYAIFQSPDGLTSIAVVGGVVFNSFKKNIVGNTTNPDQVVAYENAMYKNRTKSGLAGLRLQMGLAKNLSGTAMIQYQQTLESINKEATLFSVNPSLIGLNVGIRYHF